VAYIVLAFRLHIFQDMLSQLCHGKLTKQINRCDYESHLWDLFLYGAVDADFTGPAVMLWCPDILYVTNFISFLLYNTSSARDTRALPRFSYLVSL